MGAVISASLQRKWATVLCVCLQYLSSDGGCARDEVGPEQGGDGEHAVCTLHLAAALYPDWEDHWTIEGVADTDLSYRVVCNPDIRIQILLQEHKFLAAIQ